MFLARLLDSANRMLRKNCHCFAMRNKRRIQQSRIGRKFSPTGKVGTALPWRAVALAKEASRPRGSRGALSPRRFLDTKRPQRSGAATDESASALSSRNASPRLPSPPPKSALKDESKPVSFRISLKQSRLFYDWRSQIRYPATPESTADRIGPEEVFPPATSIPGKIRESKIAAPRILRETQRGFHDP
ncbi:MAG: hypothetical protein QOG67_323 [Verrucomicrobiota bacterium]